MTKADSLEQGLVRAGETVQWGGLLTRGEIRNVVFKVYIAESEN